MTRPRRSFGHEDAKTRCAVRNETSVPVEPLSLPAKRSSTASPSSRKPITSGANTGTATSWNSTPSTSEIPAAGSSDSIASRSGESSSISSPRAILLRRGHEHCAELVGDPEQIDADALLPALRGRGQCLGLVGRKVEMCSDRALQREVARQQDGVRLQPRAALVEQHLEDFAGRHQVAVEVALDFARDDDLREAECRQQDGDDQRRESDEDLGAQAGAHPPLHWSHRAPRVAGRERAGASESLKVSCGSWSTTATRCATSSVFSRACACHAAIV